jgi:hypothetical protein
MPSGRDYVKNPPRNRQESIDWDQQRLAQATEILARVEALRDRICGSSKSVELTLIKGGRDA